ncbi:16S rRNA (guanine(966)-N(2))-methyltransferase RsmD [Pelagibacterales bacterium SAG-MED22]|nr:16S rRNA (guanine(966)-N(2))-methyltransferase RsmD [Pelagibacterales bacterium SAG-MED22]
MRIISGSYRGKKILEPKDAKTRPLKDLTKESIFNIINHSNKFKVQLTGAKVLDLFSGVGSFGIECLSRGASKVIFAENYMGVLSVLKKNLINLRCTDSYEILEKDIYKENTLLMLNELFEIIFLDPPFKDKNLEKIFETIVKGNILKKNGIIILHRHKKEKDLIPPKFKIVEQKQYGISKIDYICLLS